MNPSGGWGRRMRITLANLGMMRHLRPRTVKAWSGVVSCMPMPDGQSRLAVAVDAVSRMRWTYHPRRMPCAPPSPLVRADRAGDMRVAHFVDAPGHVSGVMLTLREWCAQASRRGKAVEVMTCGEEGTLPGARCFAPVGSIRLPAYAGLDLHVPDIAQVEAAFQAGGYGVVHLSTPGPMGLLGLRLARAHGLPVAGTYHTDFPRYARELSGDPALESSAWRLMRGFYGGLDAVAAPSSATARELAERCGLDRDRLSVVGRGVDLARFHPGQRSAEVRARWSAGRPNLLLYVGRLSREKNIHTLIDAFRLLCARRGDVALALVGEGPARADAERALRGLPGTCAGLLEGSALAAAYASADVFLFPSLTDTFGRVLLEAQASGVPAIAAMCGGPMDAIEHGRTGLLLPQMTPSALADAAEFLLDGRRRATFGAHAREHAARFTPEASFNAYWRVNLQACERRRARQPDGIGA